MNCTTEEDLLALTVPDEVLAPVLDAMFPPSLDRVAQQPDLVVPSTEDLVKFRKGDLLGFLLRLDDEQMGLTSWALNGPTMIRGGAGTGKSTVAMYRVKALLERQGATRARRLAEFPAHPQLQRLGLFVDLAPIYPEARPAQYPRPVVVPQTGQCSENARPLETPSIRKPVSFLCRALFTGTTP